VVLDGISDIENLKFEELRSKLEFRRRIFSSDVLHAVYEPETEIF